MLIKDENYIIAVDDNGMTDEIRTALANKPHTESGYGARLKTDLTWEMFELPEFKEERQGYTEERLSEMTTAELRNICLELGISTSMNKVNMIKLILLLNEE